MKYIKKLIRFEQTDIDIITKFATQLGVTVNSALRLIVRDWDNRTNPKKGEQQK
jgi:hypothetical protein